MDKFIQKLDFDFATNQRIIQLIGIKVLAGTMQPNSDATKK